MYIKVSINTHKFLDDQINLNILIILKAQIALAAVEKLKSVCRTVKITPIIVPITTRKSNQFQLFIK